MESYILMKTTVKTDSKGNINAFNSAKNERKGRIRLSKNKRINKFVKGKRNNNRTRSKKYKYWKISRLYKIGFVEGIKRGSRNTQRTAVLY